MSGERRPRPSSSRGCALLALSSQPRRSVAASRHAPEGSSPTLRRQRTGGLWVAQIARVSER
eukprot:scaffold1484_cov241-Pinguiococcus_pyrenoidosus.AAC.12